MDGKPGGRSMAGRANRRSAARNISMSHTMTTYVGRLLTLGALLAVGVTSAASDKPNIVYILSDDLGYGDPGCFNKASRIPTPNLDQLALEGMRFTDAHAPTSVCTPTRYAILTGRYAW